MGGPAGPLPATAIITGIYISPDLMTSWPSREIIFFTHRVVPPRLEAILFYTLLTTTGIKVVDMILRSTRVQRSLWKETCSRTQATWSRQAVSQARSSPAQIPARTKLAQHILAVPASSMHMGAQQATQVRMRVSSNTSAGRISLRHPPHHRHNQAFQVARDTGRSDRPMVRNTSPYLPTPSVIHQILLFKIMQ